MGPAAGELPARGREPDHRASAPAEEKGDLKPLLKAQVSWIIARQDRAWYAAGQAKRRLKELGQTDDQIYKLDGDWSDSRRPSGPCSPWPASWPPRPSC